MVAPPFTALSQGKAKRQIMTVNSPTKAAVISAAPVVGDEWKAQLYREVEHRISLLRDDAASEKDKQHQVFTATMMKLPKNIKNMTVSEFNILYKVNLLETVVGGQSLSGTTITGKVPETPATYAAVQKSILTPSRTMRKGEVLYSKNGSPVETDAAVGIGEEGTLVATISKPNGGPQRLLGNSSMLELNVGNGKFISLGDPSNVAKLPRSQQEVTRLQLQLLKEQVDSALQQLQDE